jgi:hypothetical protein
MHSRKESGLVKYNNKAISAPTDKQTLAKLITATTK